MNVKFPFDELGHHSFGVIRLGRLGFMETFDVEFLKSHVVVFKD